ncbi:unnamed protein product (macronuclear) [Paramecium tetraurelia]|uniref:Transmembrane protein n=1 Tax=Paramecium tetraurelia TaxID=5888 RepID=A0BY00_PARTE|nr:uncharacterized protein GSPATT00033270001 [Paramecium tetraurelia]CAK63417.1 unnamed protein product [Paramecium tetraurelia]|eukprot:XP_001430815.1 hypothetical protein (macronuclear) [Paramecium tetraurelia strain d4-2]
MTRIHLILSCLIILSQQCSNLKDNTLFITSTPDEMMRIPLSQIFTSSSYDQITFSPVVPFFTITAPLEEVYKMGIPGIIGLTVSAKMLKSTSSAQPQHRMANLRSENGKYYSEYDLNYYSTIPRLDTLYPSTLRANSQCFDIALMSTIVVTECSNDDGDYFSILKIKQSPPAYLPIEKPLDSFRKLDMIDQYLLRGTANKLELYQEQEEAIVLLNNLDQAALRVLLNKDTFELKIKDFQTHTNGWISILNGSGNLITVQFKNDQWQLISDIDTQIPDVYSYDYNVYTNTYVILSKTQLYYKAITKQVFTAKVTANPTDKVHLLRSSIILLQDKTLVQYSQQLYKLYSKTLSGSNNSINSNPHSDGFLVIDNENFSEYATKNEYSLQFQAGTLPVARDYRMTKMIQSNSCEIQIYYTSIDIEWKNIYSSQIPQALIATSVFQDKVDVKLNPIFQGSNLKYEFLNTDILNIKVDQYQEFEISNIDDTPDVIYRKALSHQNNPQIQIIQQHSDQQISGFTCEVESNLKLNCKSIFAKRQFTQLQDSDKQLWWFNQNSIFLAILQDLTVTIYNVNYEESTFDTLTTINLVSNAKQIVTDGIHLFISMEKLIQAYAVTVENKATLIYNQDVIVDMDIYATPAQKNLVFLEQDGELQIISFEFEKMSLIWFTPVDTNYDQKNLIILKNHIVRIIKKKGSEEYIATVYYLKNLNNISLEKKIAIGKFSAVKLTQIQVNAQQNLFYLVGQQNEQYKLLVHKVDEPSINSMFLSLSYTSTAQFSIANQYCLVTDQSANKQVLYNHYITGNYFVQSHLKESYQQAQYSKLITLTVQVKSDSQGINTEVVPALIVNRGVTIFQNQSSLNLTYKADGAQKHYIDLGQSWYNGQAFDISQSEASKNITYVQTLSKKAETLEFSPYIQQLNPDSLVQLIGNKIVLVKKADLTKTEITLDATYNINKLLLVQDQYLYVETQKESQIYLKVVECKDSKCKFLESELAFATNIDKIFLHKNNFIIYSKPILYVYDTKGDPINVSAFEQYNKIPTFSSTFFVEFQYLQDDVYQIISVDVRGNINFNNIVLSRTSSENQVFPQDVLGILKTNQLYVQENSVCVGIVLRKDEILIFYNNIATVSFKFEFDCTNKKLCNLKQFTLNGVYQQYGEWVLFNIYPIIYSNENILSLIYWAQSNYEVLIYDLETPSSKEHPKSAIAHLTAPISEEDPGEMYHVQSFVYTQNGQLHLLASAEDPTKLQHYTLQRSPQVCTTSAEEQVNEVIKLNLHNSISNVNLNLNITITATQDPDDDDDEKKFPIWAIILIASGVLIIGVVIFIYCKKKSQTQVDDEKVLLG